MEDDARLVARAAAGSEEAVAAIYARYWPLVWRAAFAVTGAREAADDVAQDAMQRAFRALHTFDAERPLAPWLKRIAATTAIDALRSEARVRGRARELWLHELRPAPPDDAELADAVAEAVTRLSAPRRLVISLHYWLGFEVEEIARMLEIPYGTAASRLSRALADLRHALEEETNAV